MLFKKGMPPQIDFLENWPDHYYEIETALQKKDFLEKAIAQNLDPEHDPYRMKLLEKRFFKKNKKGNADSFMYAWVMIHVSAGAPVSKRQQQELRDYLKDLCLYDYTPENEAEQQVLLEEWKDFAKSYLLSCTGSRNYCSTLFGMIPLKDEAVARKIAAEINLVTQLYPSRFGLADAFLPLRQVFLSVYSQMFGLSF